MDYYQDLRPSGDLPYPNLIRAYAYSNQQGYFMEPTKETGNASNGSLRRTMVEQHLETAIAQRYPTFGGVSHLYKMDRLGKGYHEFVFYRRNRGTVDHGLGRRDEDTFECAKYNILRHPRQNDSNNPNYAAKNPGLVTGMDREMLALTNYPFLSHTVMSAPLLPRCIPRLGSQSSQDTVVEGQFLMTTKKQPSALTKIFTTPELCLKILSEIGARWDDLGNLSRTCQMIMFALNEVSTHVDLTKGEFLNLDFPNNDVDEANARATAEDIATNGKFMRPAPAEFLILSNIRGQYLGAEDGEGEPDNQGYPAPPRGRYYRRNAEDRLPDTYRLFSTINVRGSRIRMLHFHSTPYLDVSVLEKCLDELPNLQVLGVHNCELLHFGMTVPLLEAIIARNKKPGASFVRSDFSPFYYYGRQRQDDGRKGEYGVIPSDMGTVDTRRAVTAVLYTAVPLALKNGIDWFTPGTGLRKFLDRLPFSLGSIRYILEALFNLNHFKQGLYDEARGAKEQAPNLDSENDALWNYIMGRTLYNDLVIAVHGKAMDANALDSTMMSRGYFTLVTCAFCEAELPSYFFTEESANRRVDQIQCCGCQLQDLLSQQIDNFFQEKKEVVRSLFNDPNINNVDSYLNAKRVATEAEINNPQFHFWIVAVKTKAEVRKSYSGGLVLDGRPSPDHPEHTKEIWVWKDRVVQAMTHAMRYIDGGHQRAQQAIAHCQEGIEELDDLYYNGELPSQFDIKQNRNEADKLRCLIDQELARCGSGQMGGRHGTKLAADWDAEITKYRQLVQAMVGVVENQGPYNTVWNNASTGYW
ncbi:hypothetical protein F4776DRAFT_672101 [Hypoxylon sp. NC0597]|nr:hypothetical protein F4776DRAFT_672101 [Hypoxylon sp. NC0597]